MNNNIKKALRRGGYIAGLSALVISIVVIVNLIIAQLPSNVLEFDISDTKIYTVSDTSVEYLAELEQDVEIIILAEDGSVDERIIKFIDSYSALSKHLSVTQIDPVAYPSALTDYEAESDTIVVRVSDTGKQTAIPISDMIGYDASSLYYGYEVETDFDAEGLLTSAVDYVISDASHVVYTMTGHDEGDLPAAALDSIAKANLTTDSVSLLLDGAVPEDCDLLVSYAPTSDLSDDELAMLRDYMAEGGQITLLMSSEDILLPNWEALLLEYGLEVADGYVADTERYYQQSESYYYIFPNLSSASRITSGFTNDQDLVLLISARGLTEITPARDAVTVESFMTTSDASYAVTSSDQAEGPYILGAVATEETDGGETSRLTVITAQTLLDETILTSFSSLSNLDLFMNALTAGFEDVENISIPAKSLEVTYNTITGGTFWGMVFIAVIPPATLGGGLIFWIRRRKR